MEARSLQVVDELKTLQSPLAEWPAAMPFMLPGQYFESFLPNLRERLVFEEASTDSPDPVPSFGRLETPFAVPEGYFSGFLDALADGRALADLEARLSRKNVFETPPGYFETLPQAVMAAIDAEAETALPENFSRTMPFGVPGGYFENFSENLQARIQAADADSSAPVAETPRTIPLRPRSTLPVQMMRWAAAAILILGVSLGIQQAGTPQSTATTARRALANVPENALQDYVYQHADDFDMDMIEARLPHSTFRKTSPVQNLETLEIQAFLSEDALL